MVSIKRESLLWKGIALGARHTSSIVDITLDNWCNQSKRTNKISEKNRKTSHNSIVQL